MQNKKPHPPITPHLTHFFTKRCNMPTKTRTMAAVRRPIHSVDNPHALPIVDPRNALRAATTTSRIPGILCDLCIFYF